MKDKIKKGKSPVGQAMHKDDGNTGIAKGRDVVKATGKANFNGWMR